MQAERCGTDGFQDSSYVNRDAESVAEVAWDFGRELEPIYREDLRKMGRFPPFLTIQPPLGGCLGWQWPRSRGGQARIHSKQGHSCRDVGLEAQDEGGGAVLRKLLNATLSGWALFVGVWKTPVLAEQVVELEAGQSLKVAFWSMGNFCLDGLESVTFTSYQLERPGAKGKTRLQLTGKASDSPGLHVLGHPAKVFPPFDDLTLIAVHLPESRELQICPCALFNIEIDRQGKGYSDPKDPVNLNREEEPVPEEDTGPMTAKQYRDKRKLAIESFGTAKKMRSFGQVAERLDRDLEVANLEQYTGSISARVEEQLKLKQTAEEKDEETKREVLPPFIRSDDPQKIYVEPWKQH